MKRLKYWWWEAEAILYLRFGYIRDLPAISRGAWTKIRNPHSIEQLISYIETGKPQPKTEAAQRWQYVKPNVLRLRTYGGYQVELSVYPDAPQRFPSLPFFREVYLRYEFHPQSPKRTVDITNPATGESHQAIIFTGHAEGATTLTDALTFEQMLTVFASDVLGEDVTDSAKQQSK